MKVAIIIPAFVIKQSIDLAKLSQNNLTGKDLTEFINRSIDLIK